jgi:hypothetical protein
MPFGRHEAWKQYNGAPADAEVVLMIGAWSLLRSYLPIRS